MICQNNGCKYHDRKAMKGCLVYADKCDEYNEMKKGGLNESTYMGRIGKYL